MKNKNILRKNLLIELSLESPIYLIIMFLIGKLNILSVICLGIWILLTIIVHQTTSRVSNLRNYKKFKAMYTVLKILHRDRYRLYFSHDKEEIDSYSQAIQAIGEFLLDVGNDFIEENIFGKKKTLEIKEILNKIDELMNKEFISNY